MKICFLNENLNIKVGVGRFGLDMIRGIQGDKSFEVVVLTEKKFDNYKFEKPILKKSYLLRNFLNIFINAIKVRKYIKDCDIIHALDAYPYGVIASLANIGLNKKLIINGIGTYSVLPLDEPIKKWLLKWAYKKAQKVICISNFTRKQILKRIKLNNTMVINHGVDYKKFQNHNNVKKNNQKIILSVGALKPRKGYHVSIPVIAKIKEKYPNIKYYIIGGKPPEEYINLINGCGLKDNVEFLYDLSDEELINFYYKSDLFLLTPIVINNDFEGFGLVYLEAGACGKPVVGTYDCGVEDAIINNETGFLVPQNDIKKTAEAVLRLLDNPELAKKLGENGRERAKEMSWDNVVKKYMELYKNTIRLNGMVNNKTLE